MTRATEAPAMRSGIREMQDLGFTTNPSSISAWDGEGFHAEAVLHLAEHAVLVYSELPYGRAAQAAGFDRARVVKRGGAQVGIAWSQDLIVISARGSDELGDWFWNILSWLLVSWDALPPGCRVGLGFRRQIRKVAEEVVDFVKILLASTASAPAVVVTGHSLGGALVPLIVISLRAHGVPVRYAVAHESPRVGNEAFASWYDETFTYGATPTWSIVNVLDGHSDLVTRIPKRRWKFRHLGRRVILAGGKVLFGEDAWQRHRAEHPVGNGVAAWRIVTRFYRATAASIRAHFGRRLLASLRVVVKEGERS